MNRPLWKKILLHSTYLFLALTAFTACQQKEPPNTIKVGTISGPETKLMEVAKQVAKEKYGLNVKIVTFSDYIMPNTALNDGSLNANMFQHLPYLEAQIKARGYKLTSIGKTFLYPMGLYSTKLHSLNNIPTGATVGIPNDPSNEARALLLLEKADLIKLRSGAGINATTADITYNPHHLKIVTLDAAEIPRSLDDLTLAAINTNYAIPAGLSPTKDALISEGADSPYANLIVVRTVDKNNPQLHELVKAFQSEPVLEEAKKLFGNDAIPAWAGAPSMESVH